ncbi:MAG: hypothetical protein IT559_06695 [Alphaproteobacteria bacterium]|nr:hypothetical protein [Alphaproteobacteria bacterium]
MLKDYAFRFAESFSDHRIALKSSQIGADIFKFLEDKEIEITENKDMPEDVEGRFISPSSGEGNGRIEYGRHVNALILAHEGRHAWQYANLPGEIKAPPAPQDYVLVERFKEADARAIHFAVTLEICHSMRVGHSYSEKLLDCLSPSEKDLYKNDPDYIETLCANKKKFGQVVREAFDFWMIQGLGTDYDDQIQLALSQAGKSEIKRSFFPVPEKQKAV